MRYFEVIDNTDESKMEWDTCCDDFELKLSQSDIKALIDGKCLATNINCGEYTIFLTLKK